MLMEREAEYLADIARRMALANEGPMTRAHASTKARGKAEDHGPLFAGEAAVPLPQPVQEAMKI